MDAIYLIFKFGLGVTEIKVAEGIHGEVVYSFVSGGHWLVVIRVIDEEWQELVWLPKELWP